jgi:ribonuclease P protein component
VSVTWLPPAGGELPGAGAPPQVGYAIGKVVGGAVRRNLVRRRLQAVVASVAADLAPGTYLIGAGPDALGTTFEELRAALLDAFRRVPAPGGLSAAPVEAG